jgi:segregation and condensation protein B
VNLDHMKAVAEGLLFVSGDDGIEIRQLAEVLQVSELVVNEILFELKKDYEEKPRGITLIETANSFKLSTKKEHAEYFKRLVETPTSSTLSQAALETLTIIAYKQPITRVEIEEVRGVKTERPLQTLLAKSLIKEVGRSETTGRAILYGTTKEFLDYFGLKSVEELPPLPENIDKETYQEEADLFFDKIQETVED